MMPSRQRNLTDPYDTMTKLHFHRPELQGATLDGNQSQFLTDVNAIYLDMSPILSLTGTWEDSRSLDGVGSSYERFVKETLPVTLNEELDLLGGLSPLDANDFNSCLEIDLDGPLYDAFVSSKNVIGNSSNDNGFEPTLAALNYHAETLDDLELENLSLPEESTSCLIRGSSNLPTPVPNEECLGLSPVVCETISPSSNMSGSAAAAVVPSLVGETSSEKEFVENVPKSALHALLVRCHGKTDTRSSYDLGPHNPTMASGEDFGHLKIKREPLSQTVVTNSGHDQDVISTSVRSQRNRLSISSVDAGLESLEMKDAQDVDSHDEGFDSDLDDSDHYDFSDAESDNSWTGEPASSRSRYADNDNSPKSRKKERFFWQYNLQAKGPKGSRLPLATDSSDPHTLDEVSDPVFSPSCQVKGIKHTGKARRGDGNDLNPNPTKLYHIGLELKKLNKVINDLTPVGELPFNVRPKSRKEKNKLASRACRLKKKAQHEANKLKLYGLDHEHKRLMHVLDEVKRSVVRRTIAKKEANHSPGKLFEHYEHLSKTLLKTKVAGNTADFVNSILNKVASGATIETLDQDQA